LPSGRSDPDASLQLQAGQARVDVVKVFAQVAREMPAQLVLVGDGPDRSAAEWLAHDLKHSGARPFPGQAGARQRTAAAGRSAADAQRAGIVWPGRA
jgi:glycosyltransferase involved in cell wall biosynthesis